MVKKALRVVLYTIFTISLLFVVPFNNIYADGLIVSGGNDYLLGINVDYTDSELEYYVNTASIVSQNGTSNYSQYTEYNVISSTEVGTYRYTFVFNKEYTGHIVLQYVVPTTTTTRSFTLYVNGSTAEYYSTRDNRYSTTGTFINNWTLVSADLTENVTLDTLMDMRYTYFPFESFSFIANFLDPNGYFKIVDYPVIDRWNYPMFKLPSGNNIEIINMPVYPEAYEDERRTKSAYVIFITNASTATQVNNLISYSGGPQLYKQTCLYTFRLPNPDTNTYTVWGLWKYEFRTETPQQNISLKVRTTPFYIIPIYKGYGLYISNDFAQRYGLSTQMLDDLHIIANGTNDSSAASSQSDQANSQLQQDSNTLFTQEDSFKQNMNSAMQNIDTTFSLNNFGSSFMTSAQWVRTQYETLTNNTPFASLITFSLLVGLALIVIGKVYK